VQIQSPAPDFVHNKSNVNGKISKDISDKVAAAESLSSTSSTRSGQVYSESTSLSKAKVSYEIFTRDGMNVKGFLSMGKDDLDNSGTIKPASLSRTPVKATRPWQRKNPL